MICFLSASHRSQFPEANKAGNHFHLYKKKNGTGPSLAEALRGPAGGRAVAAEGGRIGCVESEEMQKSVFRGRVGERLKLVRGQREREKKRLYCSSLLSFNKTNKDL